MAKKRIKVKEHENLTDSNIQRVIDLLAEDKPITKKQACEILNISYNTTRLQTIIDNFVSRKEYEKTRRNKNRGKPPSKEEVATTINSYMNGEAVSEIAKQLYRSASFISAILIRLGVPKKETGDQKYEVSILPDECVSLNFKPGQIAWSAKYHSPCEIVHEVTNLDYEKKYGCKAYSIYIIESLGEVLTQFPKITKGGFNANALAYDLGTLEHLSEYDIKYTG